MACSAGRPRIESGRPYTVSPTIGWPIEARWTRIWWVRPVRKRELEDGRAAEPLDDAKVGDRLAAPLDDRHAPAVAGMTADGRVDRSRLLAEAAVDERPVRAPEGPIAELARQAAMRGLGLRHDEQPARVAVEAVDDAGALGATEQ